MDSQEILDKEWFYNKALTDPIIHRCIMEHEHNNISWSVALAMMVKHLYEANEAKTKMLLTHLEICTMPTQIKG